MLIESQNGLEATSKPTQSRAASHQPRASSNLAFECLQGWDTTASLHSLCWGLTTVNVKNFLLIYHLNLSSFNLEGGLASTLPCYKTSWRVFEFWLFAFLQVLPGLTKKLAVGEQQEQKLSHSFVPTKACSSHSYRHFCCSHLKDNYIFQDLLMPK